MSNLCNAVRCNDLILENILAHGQGEQLCETMTIKLQLARRNVRNGFPGIRQVGIQEGLDTLVRWTEGTTVLDQKMLLLLVRFQDRIYEREEVLGLGL